MRRRLIGNVYTGLGNPDPEKFDNKWTDNEKFNEKVKIFFDNILNTTTIFEDFGGFDFKIFLEEKHFTILFGIEPAYMHDLYICCCVNSDDKTISIQRGKANGYYGSDVVIDDVATIDFNDRLQKCYNELTGCLDK